MLVKVLLQPTATPLTTLLLLATLDFAAAARLACPWKFISRASGKTKGTSICTSRHVQMRHHTAAKQQPAGSSGTNIKLQPTRHAGMLAVHSTYLLDNLVVPAEVWKGDTIVSMEPWRQTLEHGAMEAESAVFPTTNNYLLLATTRFNMIDPCTKTFHPATCACQQHLPQHMPWHTHQSLTATTLSAAYRAFAACLMIMGPQSPLRACAELVLCQWYVPAIGTTKL
jgi:hypothetical protein